jgi:hypothetical protein
MSGWNSAGRRAIAPVGFGSGTNVAATSLPTEPTLALLGHGTSTRALGRIAEAAAFPFRVKNLAMSCRAPNVESAIQAIGDGAGFFMLGLSEFSLGKDCPAFSCESQTAHILSQCDVRLGLVTTCVDYLMQVPYLQSERRRNMVQLVVLHCELKDVGRFQEIVRERFLNVLPENTLYLEFLDSDTRCAPQIVTQIQKLVAESSV